MHHLCIHHLYTHHHVCVVYVCITHVCIIYVCIIIYVSSTCIIYGSLSNACLISRYHPSNHVCIIHHLISVLLTLPGVGNIYRAEILYKSRLHPEQPGYSLTRSQFDTVWHHCVECLQRGFTTGSILTVDPEDARILGKPWTRR